MTWSVVERRAWLFPPASGEVDAIDLADLDPAHPDDRRLLIQSEHPELRQAFEEDLDELVLKGQVMSPTLHVTMHEVVATQIWDGDPEVTWQTAERLTGLGYERHEVLHMLASVVVDEIHGSLTEQRLHRPDLLAAGFAALPESWEAERPRSPDYGNDSHRPRRGRRH